ncbi:MAG: response regulator [Bdellovibrionales bacterium]|nr:response regulator [Bdellovibrionales bacterium]
MNQEENENLKIGNEHLNILILDDDEDITNIINLYIKKHGFNIDIFNNPIEALNEVNTKEQVYDLMFVDYMMPEMNGIEFTKAIKTNHLYNDSAIVMLTAKTDPDSVSEGISAGVLHYLPKPIKKNLLESVVKSVTDQLKEKKEIAQTTTKMAEGFRAVKMIQLSFSKLEEINSISIFLSNLYPDPGRVKNGIKALLINALEHGNLEVKYKEQNHEINLEEWERQLLKKQHLPENKNKIVKVAFSKNNEEFILTIEDQGSGFDWRRYLELDQSNALKSYGRGIAMANKISFDKVEYNKIGNKVTTVVLNTNTESYWD